MSLPVICLYISNARKHWIILGAKHILFVLTSSPIEVSSGIRGISISCVGLLNNVTWYKINSIPLFTTKWFFMQIIENLCPHYNLSFLIFQFIIFHDSLWKVGESYAIIHQKLGKYWVITLLPNKIKQAISAYLFQKNEAKFHTPVGELKFPNSLPNFYPIPCINSDNLR